MNEPAVVGVDLGGTNVRLAGEPPRKDSCPVERATATMPDQAALVAGLAADLDAASKDARERGWENQGWGHGVPGGFCPGKVGWFFPPTGG